MTPPSERWVECTVPPAEGGGSGRGSVAGAGDDAWLVGVRLTPPSGPLILSPSKDER